MKMDRSIWISEFSVDAIPKYPCPQCGSKVLFKKDSLFIEETPFSKNLHSYDDWDIELIEKRFSLRLVCPDPDCGEVVMVTGDTTLIQSYDDDDLLGGSYEDGLQPHTMFPAPPIITVPNSAPSEVLKNINSSFALFWTDYASSANRLRVALEYLLDDLGVPRAAFNSKKSKMYEQNLNNRIEDFAKREPNHTDILHALRVIGNLGSHGNINRINLLDGYELMENILDELVSRRTEYIKGIASKFFSKKDK